MSIGNSYYFVLVFIFFKNVKSKICVKTRYVSEAFISILHFNFNIIYILIYIL